MDRPSGYTGSHRVFASALRGDFCSHVDYLYLSNIFLKPCIKRQISQHKQKGEVTSTDVSTGGAVVQVSEGKSNVSCMLRHLVAGGAAGAVSRTCTAPLDRLKYMLMVYGSRKDNVHFSKVVKSMMEEGGVRSFWRGNAINVAKVVPEMALKFMIYEQIKQLLKSGSTNNRELGIADRFVAGSLAGASAQSIIYPMEVLKTRLVLRKTGQYKGIVDCASNLLKHEGVRGFYRGFVPNLLGILPYAGIDLAIYETLKKFYTTHHSNNEVKPGPLVLLVCGVASSSCGQLACYPLSLVRTRLQANVSVDASATMTGTFRTIVTNDGLCGLYRGLCVNFLKVAPAVSLSYLVYETTQGFLGVSMT